MMNDSSTPADWPITPRVASSHMANGNSYYGLVTCGLTSSTLGSAPGPVVGNE